MLTVIQTELKISLYYFCDGVQPLTCGFFQCIDLWPLLVASLSLVRQRVLMLQIYSIEIIYLCCVLMEAQSVTAGAD